MRTREKAPYKCHKCCQRCYIWKYVTEYLIECVTGARHVTALSANFSLAHILYNLYTTS